MILTFKEALKRSLNPDWFLSVYKESDIASDEEVNLINELVKEVGVSYLDEYLEMKEDTLLQKEYVLDLVDYLKEIKENRE